MKRRNGFSNRGLLKTAGAVVVSAAESLAPALSAATSSILAALDFSTPGFGLGASAPITVAGNWTAMLRR